MYLFTGFSLKSFLLFHIKIVQEFKYAVECSNTKGFLKKNKEEEKRRGKKKEKIVQEKLAMARLPDTSHFGKARHGCIQEFSDPKCGMMCKARVAEGEIGPTGHTLYLHMPSILKLLSKADLTKQLKKGGKMHHLACECLKKRKHKS